MEDWQVKHSHPDFSTKLTTGFLDGVHPIVDAYELKVGITVDVWILLPRINAGLWFLEKIALRSSSQT